MISRMVCVTELGALIYFTSSSSSLWAGRQVWRVKADLLVELEIHKQ